MKPICLTLLPVLGLGLATMEAAAETWPTKPLRAIVPFGAGSTTDIIPRVVFEQLSSQLGQSIVVENRTGAGGTIGTGFVAKADPDGYTVLVHSDRAHDLAVALFEPELPSGARFCGGHPAGHYRRTSWSFRRPRAGRRSAISSPQPKPSRAR